RIRSRREQRRRRYTQTHPRIVRGGRGVDSVQRGRVVRLRSIAQILLRQVSVSVTAQGAEPTEQPEQRMAKTGPLLRASRVSQCQHAASVSREEQSGPPLSLFSLS